MNLFLGLLHGGVQSMHRGLSVCALRVFPLLLLLQVSLFLRKFQLTAEEVEALSAPLEADQGKRFFSALLRLKTVRASCGRLVGSSPQSAG